MWIFPIGVDEEYQIEAMPIERSAPNNVSKNNESIYYNVISLL